MSLEEVRMMPVVLEVGFVRIGGRYFVRRVATWYFLFFYFFFVEGIRVLFKLGGFRLTYFFLAISFFLLLLLLTICFFFHMLYPISTKLGQNDHWVSRYKSYQQFDLKGHVRVTEVKKVILKENATPPTWFIGFWRNLVRITSRQVATKVINSLTLKVM